MKRVLIVDKNVSDRVVLSYYVSKYFLCDIYTASGSQEALERIDIIKPDIVIAGIAIHVDDEISFIKTLLLLLPGVPVIALSAVNEKSVVDLIKKSGKLTYLNKPVNSYRIYKKPGSIFNYK